MQSCSKLKIIWATVSCIVCKKAFDASDERNWIVCRCGAVSHLRCYFESFRKSPICPNCRRGLYIKCILSSQRGISTNGYTWQKSIEVISSMEGTSSRLSENVLNLPMDILGMIMTFASRSVRSFQRFLMLSKGFRDYIDAERGALSCPTLEFELTNHLSRPQRFVCRLLVHGRIENLSDDTLARLFPNLRHLGLKYNNYITDKVLIAYSETLTSLSLFECSRFSLRGVKCLTKLKELKVFPFDWKVEEGEEFDRPELSLSLLATQNGLRTLKMMKVEQIKEFQYRDWGDGSSHSCPLCFIEFSNDINEALHNPIVAPFHMGHNGHFFHWKCAMLAARKDSSMGFKCPFDTCEVYWSVVVDEEEEFYEEKPLKKMIE